jgi:23S rRNA pseudoU1915 N3-methylase RlmH
MKALRLRVVCVGKPGRALARPIVEYETRAARHVDLRIIEVKAGRGDPVRVRAAGAAVLLESLPERCRIFFLTREGDRRDTRGLADERRDSAVYGPGGAAWLIGGAFGLWRTLSQRRLT